ncbi:MAG: hypothetical protein WBE18_05720 [Gammaproteobacteria bacterium]
MGIPHSKGKRAITIILPQFLPKQVLDEILENANPLLEASITYFERTLFSLFQFDINSQLPAAAITALAGGLAVNQSGWLRADPVAIAVGANNAYLVSTTHLQITAAEMVTLQALLNNLLLEDGFQLHMIGNHEWCLELPEKPDIITFSPSQVLGKAIGDYLPHGKGAKKWQTLLTEIQMLLHESVVNRKRATCGQPLINSLWFWGEGNLPKIKPLPQWQQIWYSNLLIKGLGMFTNTHLVELPQHFNQCLTQMDKSGEYLLDLSGRYISEEVKNQWLNPVLIALRARKLISINLCLSDGSLYNVNDRQRRPWWRRFF